MQYQMGIFAAREKQCRQAIRTSFCSTKENARRLYTRDRTSTGQQEHGTPYLLNLKNSLYH